MKTFSVFKNLLKEIYCNPVELDKKNFPSHYEFSKFAKFVSRITLSLSVGIPIINLVSGLLNTSPIIRATANVTIVGFEMFLVMKCMNEMKKHYFFDELNQKNGDKNAKLEAAWMLYDLRQAEIKEENKNKNKKLLRIENFLYSLRIIQKNQLIPLKQDKLIEKKSKIL